MEVEFLKLLGSSDMQFLQAQHDSGSGGVSTSFISKSRTYGPWPVMWNPSTRSTLQPF